MPRKTIKDVEVSPNRTTKKLVMPAEMPSEYEIPQYPDSIEGLLNGHFQRPTEVGACLWTGDDAFSAGVGLIELRSRTRSLPPPWDFIAAFYAATHRYDSVAEEIFYDFRRHYALKEPLWVAALEAEIGRRRKPPKATPQADAVLLESGDDFFLALLKFWEAIEAKKSRDQLQEDDWTEEVIRKPRKLLEEALEVFMRTSQYYAGRACKEIYDDTDDLDEQLRFIERANRHFARAQHSHMEFRVREAKTKNKFMRKKIAEGYKNRSIEIGDRIRTINQAQTLEDFAAGVVQFLVGPEMLGFGSVAFVRDEDGLEIAKSGVTRADYSVEIPIGSGFTLRFSDNTDLNALELVIPAVRTPLRNLIDRQNIDNRILPITFGSLKFYDKGYIPVVDYLKTASETPNGKMILLLGNTGTGKGMWAKAIHDVGRTTGRPWTKINSAEAAHFDIFRATLCGAAKGAWTDKRNTSIGHFKRAENGTLFLDEIGEITDETAKWFLQTLEDRSYNPVGDAGNPTPILCRVIAATNQPWEEWAKVQKKEELEFGRFVSKFEGFRPDLYYRFHFKRTLPNLREVPNQIRYVAETVAAKQCISLDSGCMDFLVEYAWPGNMRELTQVIEAVADFKGTGQIISTDDLLAVHPYLKDGDGVKTPVTGSLPAKTTSELDEPPAAVTGPLKTPIPDGVPSVQMEFLTLFRELIAKLEKPASRYFNNSEMATISRLKTQVSKIRTPGIFASIVAALKTCAYCQDGEGKEKLHRLVETFYEMNPELQLEEIKP